MYSSMSPLFIIFFKSKFVVYENPKDYPGKWIVRKWVKGKPEIHPTAIMTTLEKARKVIPKGLENIGRMTGDDPCIYEVWL